MLGVDSAAAVALFTSLRNHRAQRDGLRAAASVTLTGAIAEIFEAILQRHGELDKQRNLVIHGIWGRCDATPDGVIWCSLQDYAIMHLNDYHMEAAEQLTHDSRVDNMTKNLFVVRLRDLEELNEQIEALARSAGSFHGFIRYQDHPAGKHALHELQNDPALIEKRAAIKARGA